MYVCSPVHDVLHVVCPLRMSQQVMHVRHVAVSVPDASPSLQYCRFEQPSFSFASHVCSAAIDAAHEAAGGLLDPSSHDFS